MALFIPAFPSITVLRFQDLSAPLVLQILLASILLVVLSVVFVRIFSTLRGSESAGWTSARRLAGRSTKDLREMSASFKNAGVGAKMRRGKSRRGRRDRDSGEMDVEDACCVM